MSKIYLLIIFFFISCQAKKTTEKNSLSSDKEAIALKMIINKYGFTNIDDGKDSLNYELDSLGKVVSIWINNLDIDTIPNEIFEFKNLDYLNLKYCQFSDIPHGVSELKQLRAFYIVGNPIKEIKNTKISNSIQTLRLDKCPLEKFPHFTKENDSIPYRLFLPDTKIDSIPDFVGDMNIKTLWLQRCPITYISPNLGNCENMEELQFEANPFLKEFPASLAKLKKMRKIHFNWLPIKKIPDFVFEWPNLKTIKVNRCFIEEIPAEIGKLKNLTHLYAKGNKIKTLPKEMGELKEMHLIHLDGNPIDTKSLPAELFFPREDDYKALLITSATGCYTCFSVPEEQVRKAFDLD